MRTQPTPQLIYDTVGKYIKRFAYEKFGSVKGLSDYLQIKPSYLSQVIHGKRKPSRAMTLRLLARGFDDKLIQFYENLQLQSDVSNLSRSDLIMMIDKLTSLLNHAEYMIGVYKELSERSGKLSKK